MLQVYYWFWGWGWKMEYEEHAGVVVGMSGMFLYMVVSKWWSQNTSYIIDYQINQVCLLWSSIIRLWLWRENGGMMENFFVLMVAIAMIGTAIITPIDLWLRPKWEARHPQIYCRDCQKWMKTNHTCRGEMEWLWMIMNIEGWKTARYSQLSQLWF